MADFIERLLQGLGPIQWRIACWVLMPLGALVLMAGAFLLAGAFMAVGAVVGMLAIELLCALAGLGGVTWAVLACRN